MSDLQRYADFQPTGFDAKGLHARTMGKGDEGDEDRSDWLVGPVSRTRDSDDDPLTASNWDAAIAALGGEGPDVEIHRFGHWGPGWFEIVLVRPETTAATIADEIADSLSDYPSLDDEGYSAREYEQAIEGIRDQAGSWVRDDAPEDWPEQVYRKIPDPGVYSEPGGGSVDKDKLKAICRKLRLIAPRYLLVRVLGLRQVRRPGFAPFYRDITVKRYNPDYPF